MKTDNTSSEHSAFELKGSVLTVMVLHVREVDPDLLSSQLRKKINQARAFFKNAPVIIDLKGLDEERQAAVDILSLAYTIRGLGLVPVGVRGDEADIEMRAHQAGLGVLPAARAEKAVAIPEEKKPVEQEPPQKSPKKPPQKEEAPPAPSPPPGPGISPAVETAADQEAPVVATRVITHPIRSGQQIVAPHGDLVILSSVNAGAEVLAAGNIHVYGTLRGRALAGTGGNTSARIFSLQCNPELVAVAGEYVVNEMLDKRFLNQSVIISLEENGLRFKAIGTFTPYA
ncbi:septum site-determining protein MinC [Desulfobulbus alkaliphilus]|uniref:septum site-determining protein MinC n=1 Tax=Desulfobulbus alkaliphilus TaxID=869814 RepID=UPI001965ED96|nr:septum site-determining protein MinC [Desulfobulbus alkaliphilus]MBM9535618.1 septum site-determining protein MinC [Desulfobulbus alkaliphilus]